MKAGADGFVADACVVAAIRRARVPVAEFLGDIDVVPTLIVIDEVLFGLPRDHPIYRENVAVLAQMGPPIRNRPNVVFRATDLRLRYARHHGPPQERDSLIAAAALETGRAVITANVADFHYYEGLGLVDSGGHGARDGALMAQRAIEAGGISRRACCAAIRADRAQGQK